MKFKPLLLATIFALFLFPAISQVSIAMTNPSTCDSTAVKYVTLVSPINNSGTLVFSVKATKRANTGTWTGTIWLEGSNTSTGATAGWNKVKTVKTVATGAALITGINKVNPIDVDTLIWTAATAEQDYYWLVNTPSNPTVHPFVQYRLACTTTTGTWDVVGYWSRRQ